jgi:hypothetical protein
MSEILDLIDGAIGDWTSEDSMRWSPDVAIQPTPSPPLEASTRWVRAGIWVESADGRRIQIELVEGPGMPLEGTLSIHCEPVEDLAGGFTRGYRQYLPGPRIGHVDIRGLVGPGTQR